MFDKHLAFHLTNNGAKATTLSSNSSSNTLGFKDRSPISDCGSVCRTLPMVAYSTMRLKFAIRPVGGRTRVERYATLLNNEVLLYFTIVSSTE